MLVAKVMHQTHTRRGMFLWLFLTISSLWSSRFLMNKANSRKESSEGRETTWNKWVKQRNAASTAGAQPCTTLLLSKTTAGEQLYVEYVCDQNLWLVSTVPTTLTYTSLIVCLCIPDVLKVKLPQGVGKLSLRHPQLWKKGSNRKIICNAFKIRQNPPNCQHASAKMFLLNKT